jgi:Histidine kinase-, DNA gyrase B-, and HSP90-like ATPase
MSEEVSKHEFGPGVIPELATRLYNNPIATFREAVSNALDAMIDLKDKRVEIRTDVRPGGDITIEDWGTGIEDYSSFKKISPGEKRVGEEVSSRTRVNEKIIGEKGMGKLSFLNLSEVNTVEFLSNHENVGMHVIMTMEKFIAKYMNSTAALSHHGLKITIKQAKKSDTPETKRLVDYLGRVFAIRIARDVQIIVNGERVPKPESFDSHQFELFKLDNGRSVYGNLKSVAKPKSNNIDFCVKRLFIESKPFDYQVEGWINCDDRELNTSREGLYEGGQAYVELMNKLYRY